MNPQTLRTELLEPGTEVAGYELIRRLAIGGMAEIHLARKRGIEGFEKLVVLKRILPQYAADPEFVAMFLDEARLAASLHHANIAQVYDIGQQGGSFYFAMEFIHGEDARSVLRQCVRIGRRLPLEDALTIARGAAAGLHAAHVETDLDGQPLGIVHRDVSPSNLLVGFDGNVKVVDFGVAKAERKQSSTRAGTLKGKVAYMSPEQIQGGVVDARSDVFGLGVVLWELTTNRRLFRAETEIAVAHAILAGARRPSSELPSYPAQLEAVVMRALDPDPERRYQSAQELQLEIEGFAADAGLALSEVALAATMRELFAEKLTLWRLEARDHGRGRRHAVGTAPMPALAEAGVHTGMFVGALPGEGEAEAEAEETATQASIPRPAARGVGRGWLVLAGAVAVAGLALLLVVPGLGGGEAAEAPDETAEEAPATRAPAGHRALEAPRLTAPLVSPTRADAPDEAPARADAARRPRARPAASERTPARAPAARRPRSGPAASSGGRARARGEDPAARRSGRPAAPRRAGWDPDSPLPPAE